MNKLIVLFLASFCALSQTPPVTPNIGLYLPVHGSLNWDTWYNDNWSILDSAVANWHNVKSYGAAMNGTTDDSAALQTCISTGFCFIPLGTLKFSTTASFTLASGGAAHLWCQSPASILSYTGSGDALAALGSGQNNPGFTIENCTIHGTSSGVSGVHVRAFQYGHLRQVSISGFTSGDGFLNEGANTLWVNCACSGNVNGIHEKGITVGALNYSANANHFTGVAGSNSKWGVYEDASYASVAGANQQNDYAMVFETNGTASVASGQVYFQGCDICDLHDSYIEAARPSSVPYSIVVGGTASDGIGNVSYRVNKVVIKNNWLGTYQTPSVNIINSIGTTVQDNWEAGTPTYFVDIGTGISPDLTILRNLSLTTYAINGSDTTDTLLTDASTAQINSQVPGPYGMGFFTITGSVSGSPLNIRANSGSSSIANFQNSSGASETAIDTSGRFTFGGFNGVPYDSPGFKYQQVTSCTTSASAYSACNTTITWATPFSDVGYVAVCSVAGSVNGPVSVINQPTHNTGSLVVTIANYGSNAAASYTALACAAWHP